MTRTRLYLLLALALACSGAGALSLRRLLAGLPSIESLEDYTPSLTTRLFDAAGETAAEFSIEKRALLPLAEIPVDLRNAVVAVEDDSFFTHWGISPRGMLRAAVRNLLARRVVQGASTITQQLAKQIFLRPERTLVRKLREQLLAVQIERSFSKEEILQLYLNQVYFGEGAYGVQAAARNYFGKEVGELSLPDAALLAGLIRAPRANSPFHSPDNARRRRAVVLQRMAEEGFIATERRAAAEAEPLPLLKPAAGGSRAPYFTEHVRRRLEMKYGTSAVWRGGLKIRTTLHLEWQRIAEEEMEKALAEFDLKASSEHARKLAEYEASGEPLPPELSTSPPAAIQGAFALMDVKTGAVRAMVGGRGSAFNRVTQAKRQPGSTFKPFVWAAALGAGMTPASTIEDSPLAFYFDGRDWRLLEGATDQYSINLATQPFAASPDFKIWVPNNFDGKFLGRITLRRALALSRNISAINLINKVGPPLVVEVARRAGIRSELEPAPALGLGASVVSPLELVNAFATFANGGVAVTPYTIEGVEDAAGRRLEAHEPSDREALTPQLAYLMTSLLKSVVEGGTGSHARRLRRPLAGKTGTSNDNRDLWFVGFTPDYAAVAWMGYDDFASLGRKDWTGGSTVVPWWTAIMERVLADQPKRDFPVPPGVAFAAVDADTGFLFRPSCPKNRRFLEAFLQGAAPARYCDVDHSQPAAPPDPAPGAAAAPPLPGSSVLPPGAPAPAASPAAEPPAADPDPEPDAGPAPSGDADEEGLQ